MGKKLLEKEDISFIAESVLTHCYGNGINQDMINRTSEVIKLCLEKIMEKRNKEIDTYPYLISEDELRTIFEEQHKGRDLTKNHRGNYRSPQIAAIWNQHYKTARTVELLLTTQLQGKK